LPQPGVFEIRDVDLAGRIGRLYTKSGVVETPAFFPVIDIERQEVPLSDIASAGFGQVITNAYLILKRYGWEAASRQGVHRLLGFEGVVMTDSGAYQILEYGRVEVAQETIIRFQQAIGSDIAVILDVPTGDVGRREAEGSVEETLRRAREAISLIAGDAERVWVLPVQGGKYFDLVERSAREAAKLSRYYRAFGLGSPTVFMERYLYDVVVEGLYRARRILPLGRPLHLFGAGHPLIIPFAVALGADTFDSASYILYARDMRYMTEWGVYRVEELDYFPCSCPVCTRYTPQEIREMSREEAVRLIALHNLYVISRVVRRVKQAIREGRLWEVLEETGRYHPSTARLLRSMRRYRDLLEVGAHRGRGRVKGLRAYGDETLYNPKLSRFREEALKLAVEAAERFKPREALLVPMARKPEPGECEEASVEAAARGVLLILYTPYVGAFPVELCGVYPSLQLDFPGDMEPRGVITELSRLLAALVEALEPRGVRVRVEACLEAPWSVAAALRAYESLQAQGYTDAVFEIVDECRGLHM
jgi:7-cyano-7-deazaguanine tRNA-ribosyltransferase